MMDELIKRQDTVNAICTRPKFGIDERNRLVRWHEGLEPYVKLRDVVWAIEKTPSADQSGSWIEMGTNKDGTHNIKCSKCGEGYKTRGHARSIATKTKYSFCPNCGSYNGGEEE